MWYVNLYNFCPSWMIAEAVPTKIQLMISQDHQEEKAFGGQFLPLSRTIRAPFYRNNSKRKWRVHCVKSWTKRIVHCYTQHSKTNIDWLSVIVCLRMWTKLCDVQVPRCVRLVTYSTKCCVESFIKPCAITCTDFLALPRHVMLNHFEWSWY